MGFRLPEPTQRSLPGLPFPAVRDHPLYSRGASVQRSANVPGSNLYAVTVTGSPITHHELLCELHKKMPPSLNGGESGALVWGGRTRATD